MPTKHGNTRARFPGNKYFIREMSAEVAAQPLVMHADAISRCRGFETHSARWWQVLHFAHDRLQTAHEMGQAYAIKELAERIERLKPESVLGEALTRHQEIEAEAIDTILDVMKRFEIEPPETPSTGSR